MSYESTAEPIKVGYLFDFLLPDSYPATMREDLTLPFQMVFEEGFENGVIDRPVEIVFREVEGLPKGSVKAVIDAYGELVDEGCLLVFGPSITDNCVPTREAIENDFRVPAISVTGSEEWLGEWTFSLSMGSMIDEPIFWAHLLAKGGHSAVGMLVEQSRVGLSYAENFRPACRDKGIRIVGEELIAQTARDIGPQVAALKEAGADSILHCGFGLGLVLAKPALDALDWHPPRFTGTAFQNSWLNEILWDAVLGWTGFDQYDEDNEVGQEFLDRFEQRCGRRPQYCVPVVNRDLATIMLTAFANATPLSPRGVKEAMERVRMIPAASGSPGTKLGFGAWTRRGWVGSTYLVARRLDSDGTSSHLVDRFV